MTAATVVHKFEERGLGVAPFRFVRIEVRKYRAHPDAPLQVGGCCAYCGEGIMECCVIRDANGKEFIVGNVCVGKTGDRGLVDVVKREVNRERTKARHVRESERIAQAKALLERVDIQHALASQPHPLEWRAQLGDTKLQWAQWMLQFAGNAGKVQVAKCLEALA